MKENLFLQGVELSELLEQVRIIVREEIKQMMGTNASEEKLLSPSQACALFVPKISKVTLNNWQKAGRLQMHRIGGRCYYRQSEILAKLDVLKPYKKAS